MIDIINYIKEVFHFKENNDYYRNKLLTLTITTEKGITDFGIRIKNIPEELDLYEIMIWTQNSDEVYSKNYSKKFCIKCNDIEVINDELSKFPLLKQKLREFKLNKLLKMDQDQSK